MTFALDIQELTLCREELELIRALSLQVKPGELIQVAGPNGAGKSTLLRAIAGLYAGFEGRISIENESDAEVRRARCLLWTALPGIKSRLTAFQNLKWLLALRGDDGDCNELLSRVGLSGWEDSLAGELSTGQGRRIAMASLYASRAPIWLLDEPFNAIDSAGQQQLSDCIRHKVSQGGAVLLATHHTPADLIPDQIVSLEAAA